MVSRTRILDGTATTVHQIECLVLSSVHHDARRMAVRVVWRCAAVCGFDEDGLVLVVIVLVRVVMVVGEAVVFVLVCQMSDVSADGGTDGDDRHQRVR